MNPGNVLNFHEIDSRVDWIPFELTTTLWLKISSEKMFSCKLSWTSSASHWHQVFSVINTAPARRVIHSRSLRLISSLNVDCLKLFVHRNSFGAFFLEFWDRFFPLSIWLSIYRTILKFSVEFSIEQNPTDVLQSWVLKSIQHIMKNKWAQQMALLDPRGYNHYVLD